MAKIIIDTATFALVLGPAADDDELVAGQGQTLVVDLADSLLTGASVWDSATQSCTDPPPPPVTAYEFAVARGFVGTEAEWLESLKGAAAPTPLRAVRVADLGRGSNALGDDPALTIGVAAAAVYRVRVMLLFDIASAAADARWSLVGPAGAVLTMANEWVTVATAGFALGVVQSVTVAAPGLFVVRASGVLTTAANAGSLALQWAQITTTPAAASTLRRGSFIELDRLI